MRIAVIEATGNVGTRIVDEALSRGHTVCNELRSRRTGREVPDGLSSVHHRAIPLDSVTWSTLIVNVVWTSAR
jgi:putative NADH-flavin reductase